MLDEDKVVTRVNALAVTHYYDMGREDGFEAGTKHGRSTLSVGWFLAVAIGMLLIGGIAGNVSGYMAHKIQMESETK